ncbi:MAG: OmpA family protein [Myxococcales bacterium]|nr:OmpA family protein [Myxococcales bacterium]
MSSADCGVGVSCVDGLCDVTNASRALYLCSYPIIRFDFDRATLSDDAQAGLNQVADCIRSAGGTLIVEGHCDERGTEAYNLALGDRRAQAVVKYLSDLGVPRSMMSVISKGENEPLVSGSDPAAWNQNRRAEFEVAE